MQQIDNPLKRCELKFQGDGLKQGQFAGYASTFGNVDSFGDTILRGAFAATLKDRVAPVRMFYQHSPFRPIGIWKSIKEDEVGLAVVGELTPGNSEAQNVYASMKHGAMDGLSIGFNVEAGGAEEKENGGRLLRELDLIEISPVSLPAEKTAMVLDVKMQDIASLKRMKDFEACLRDSGMFSRNTATAFVSRLKSACQRESDAELIEQIDELKRLLLQYESGDQLAALFDQHIINIPE